MRSFSISSSRLTFLFPGVTGTYAIFFMGISEISTCVLCLLANFDPVMGVVGLDAAFPTTKVVLGAIFVVTFIICRIILWPLVTYHYMGDVSKVLKRDGERETNTVKFALKLLLVTCSALSILQVVFLGEIIRTAIVEVGQFM